MPTKYKVAYFLFNYYISSLSKLNENFFNYFRKY